MASLPNLPRLGISGRLARTFQANPLTPILALLGLLLGLVAVMITPREEEPQIDVTMANVIVPFPGADARQVEMERHLEGCASCRAAAAALEETWERIALPDPDVSVAFRERTIGRMQEALARRNVAPFRPRTWWRPALQAAALLVAGVGGFLLARASAPSAGFHVAGLERAEMPAVAVVSERQLDASRVGLDLTGNPRLLNVAFRPSEGDGRLSISFDVTTRYHVSGRADDRAVAFAGLKATYRLVADYMGWKRLGEVLVGGLEAPDAVSRAGRALARADALGARLG